MTHWTAHLHYEEATQALGAALARVLQPGLTIYLHGELGAGKTSLTRALLHATGYQGRVKSPTYTLLEPYVIQLEGRSIELMHFDLYRMNHPDEFTEAGFRDFFSADRICVVEWPERAENLLPNADLDIFISVAAQGRGVELRANSVQGASCLEQLHFSPNL